MDMWATKHYFTKWNWIYKRRCLHEILQWDEATIPGNRCIQSRTGSWPTTYKRRYKLSKRWCTWQQYPENNHLGKQELVSHRKRYSDTETAALGMLNGLEHFHHYCFAREVSNITKHKPLVAIFKKDVATLVWRLQNILLRIHQYRARIIYKPGPDLFRADWLSRQNHMENKDDKIPRWK